MRPSALNPLFAPVTSLKGVGPRIGKLIERAAGPLVVHLLWQLPAGIIDRRFSPKVADAPSGAIVTLRVTVDSHFKPTVPRQPYKVFCHDETGGLELVFFHPREDYLKTALPVLSERVVSGRVERYGGALQMSHPDAIVAPEELDTVQKVEPVYGLTAGLTPRPMRNAVAAAMARAPALEEWQDSAWLAQRGWRGWRDALEAAHAPQSADELEPAAPARARLAYDELLANQLALGLMRGHQKQLRGRKLVGDGRLRAKALAALPYRLTGAQEAALAEILADMAADHRMLRMLQGDVGSGKTVVAVLAMLAAVEAGAQAALMAPTEILARQHFATLAEIAGAAGIESVLVTGREKGAARDAVRARLAKGEVALAVGTHALFQEDIEFKDLAFAVVDEQHRFGVHQRLLLAGKGQAIDMLVMSATPIPRTLMLTAYGDLDVSRLTEKPAGRPPVDTRAVPLARIEQVITRLRTAIAEGARVYWVCPLVEESEQLDVAAATERHAALAERFGARVGLVHGRMRGPDKDRAVAAFAAGDIDILVATTVIEVGVDVPEATIMVVEHAERFGLAQLHQLRGRVGRGRARSACLLLYGEGLGEMARKRLEVLRETDDGFRIAEEDLKLRGPGELLGTRQSGLPQFRLADLAAHGELMQAARDDAALILARDPDLAGPRGRALRTLLYLFERDSAVRTLRSG